MDVSCKDLVQLGRNCWRGFVSKSIFSPITVERISLSDVISRQAGKECAMHPAAKLSQRDRREFIKIELTKSGNPLTASFKFSTIIVRGRPLFRRGLVLCVVVRFFASRLSVAFPQKRLPCTTLAGSVISSSLIRVVAPMAFVAVLFPVGANCFSNATRLLNIANLFRKVVAKQ